MDDLVRLSVAGKTLVQCREQHLKLGALGHGHLWPLAVGVNEEIGAGGLNGTDTMHPRQDWVYSCTLLFMSGNYTLSLRLCSVAFIPLCPS